jgi:hypothetical protein
LNITKIYTAFEKKPLDRYSFCEVIRELCVDNHNATDFIFKLGKDSKMTWNKDNFEYTGSASLFLRDMESNEVISDITFEGINIKVFIGNQPKFAQVFG